MSETPLSTVFEWRFVVPGTAIDGNGHVNNVAYVQWMQEVAIAHFEDLGGQPVLDQLGASWVARSHHIEYLRPAFEGEELKARTWIATMERVKSERRYEFVRGETVLARGRTEWVLVDATSGRPKRIPDEMSELLSKTKGDLANPDA